jgi:DNA-binding FrmR family transcriptional regulator
MFIFHFHDNGPRRPGIQMIEQGQPCPQVAQQLYCKQPDWRKNILELSQSAVREIATITLAVA